MQEQRRAIGESLRRIGDGDHGALRQRVEPGPLGLRQLSGHERDQRPLAQDLVGGHVAQQLEAHGLALPASHNDDAQVERLVVERFECNVRFDPLDLDAVAAREQRGRLLVQLAVLGDQRDPPHPCLRDRVETVECRVQRVLVERLFHERRGARPQSVDPGCSGRRSGQPEGDGYPGGS